MPFGIGVTELVILLVALLVIFGPKRLPEMGRSLGKGMREFKDSISGKETTTRPCTTVWRRSCPRRTKSRLPPRPRRASAKSPSPGSSWL